MGKSQNLNLFGANHTAPERTRNSSLEADISADILRQAEGIVDLGPVGRGERVSRKELLRRFSALRNIGYPVARDYRKMPSTQLYMYLNRLSGEVARRLSYI